MTPHATAPGAWAGVGSLVAAYSSHPDRTRAMPYRPPRLGDILHVLIGPGRHHYAAVVESVGDDGRTLTVAGPAGPDQVVMVIQRVGAVADAPQAVAC